MKRGAAEPTHEQVEAARDVTEWYLNTYHKTPHDVGVAAMFCDPAQVGSFAVRAADLAAGDAKALYALLTAVVMFQRRQDQQIARVLRGISAEDARELTDPDRLIALAMGCGCDLIRDLDTLKAECDLTKHGGVGGCEARPAIACAPKRHTVLLKRYGHFGKVPTALALSIRVAGATDLADLYAQVTARLGPEEASEAVEIALTRAWRVSDKIVAMFLSILCNEQLSVVGAPWTALDPTAFVVIDSNVDLFLAAIGYNGSKTYAARRAFIKALARGVDLAAMRAGLRGYDPRLVQQAMFMFMSASNRRARGADCDRSDAACSLCSPRISPSCPVRGTKARGKIPQVL